jgi:HEAT repeat protein
VSLCLTAPARPSSAHKIQRVAKLEQRMEQLRRLRTVPLDESGVALVRKALQDHANLIVAEGAKVVAAHQLTALIPDLLSAFDRLFESPVKSDPKCFGKLAIVQALTRLDYSEAAPFIRAARHVQKEPIYGGHEDTALTLRGASVLALVASTDMGRTEIFRELVEALVDRGDPVRIDAVRAIAQMSGDEASLLLRLKARIGDSSSSVTGQVFDALLSLDREKAVTLVAEFLNSSDEEVRDEAAFALGSSRLPQGVQALIDAWNRSKDREFRDVIIRSLGASRWPAAIEFLLVIIRTGLGHEMTTAIEALKTLESVEIQSQVEQAKKARS